MYLHSRYARQLQLEDAVTGRAPVAHRETFLHAKVRGQKGELTTQVQRTAFYPYILASLAYIKIPSINATVTTVE